MRADWNYELAGLPTGPKTGHIEGQKGFLSGQLCIITIIIVIMKDIMTFRL